MVKKITNRLAQAIVLLVLAVSTLSAPPSAFRITPDVRAALNHISADSLRGHLSFIASDALEGRATPSRGLDLAAEYIAAQFRRVGLEPAGDDGYFQTASVTPRGADKPVQARNVIGVLRGSDPTLKDTYVLVTAHYDHLGIKPGEGDTIYNGANDDGSGTVSVIELAAALASMKNRPRRSIVFMTFFGEERGLLGSRYYGQHPVFPLDKTVADINLEQVGRTDSDEGPQVNNASMTGFDFSEVGQIFKAAGLLTGINVYKHPRNSDAFFSRSDNQALADQGVPAHTLCVAYVYPDYHRAGDHWEKIDYQNMAKVDRCVALALVMIANNPQPPRWNAANLKAARYLQAWKTHHEKAAAEHQ
ncbi:MAG TPA: M28 family peptidase [Blastocatellia bacterium]